MAFGLLCAAPLLAQPASYRAPDIRYYRAVNPYRMYLIRDGDTLGMPVRALTVERQEWFPHQQALRVIVIVQSIDVSGERNVDTLDVAPNGRVLAHNGEANKVRGRYDFVPRLPVPSRTLVVGMTWTDSTGTQSRSTAGDYAFIIHRRYRVTRQLDTLGARVFEFEATGTLRYRDAYWMDSTAGESMWLDVTGPLHERSLFDPARGELVADSWSMHLRGLGGFSPDADTLEAGLISANSLQLVTADVGELLLRPLPVGDSSTTIRPGEMAGPLLLHTVRRMPTTVSSGLVRNDGMTGTAESTFGDNGLRRHEVLWTDSLGTRRHILVERVGDSLMVVDSTMRRVHLPGSHWAVADYGMTEHLVPLFASLPADSARVISVYRPFASRWDTLTVVARVVKDMRIMVVTPQRSAARDFFLIVDGDDLLFVESEGPSATQRLPREGSARRARLDAILKELQPQ